jgi:hypothetical protein
MVYAVRVICGTEAHGSGSQVSGNPGARSRTARFKLSAPPNRWATRRLDQALDERVGLFEEVRWARRIAVLRVAALCGDPASDEVPVSKMSPRLGRIHEGSSGRAQTNLAA